MSGDADTLSKFSDMISNELERISNSSSNEDTTDNKQTRESSGHEGWLLKTVEYPYHRFEGTPFDHFNVHALDGVLITDEGCNVFLAIKQ